MKKIYFLIALFTTSLFCDYEIINLKDIPNHPELTAMLSSKTDEELLSFFKNWPKERVVAIEKDSIFSLHFDLHSSFFSISNPEAGKIRIDKTIFLKVEDQQLLLSTDLDSWKEWRSFFTGTLGCNLGLQQDNQPFLGISFEAEERK